MTIANRNARNSGDTPPLKNSPQGIILRRVPPMICSAARDNLSFRRDKLSRLA